MISETCPGWGGISACDPAIHQGAYDTPPIADTISHHMAPADGLVPTSFVEDRGGRRRLGPFNAFHRGGFPVLPDVPHGDA